MRCHYSHGHPVSRNQPKQSSKQDGTLGIHIRSRSEPRAAYFPGQIVGRFPACCVVPTFREQEARFFSHTHFSGARSNESPLLCFWVG